MSMIEDNTHLVDGFLRCVNEGKHFHQPTQFPPTLNLAFDRMTGE